MSGAARRHLQAQLWVWHKHHWPGEELLEKPVPVGDSTVGGKGIKCSDFSIGVSLCKSIYHHRGSWAPNSFLKHLSQAGPETSPGQNKHTSEHPHLPQQAMVTRALLPATASRKAYFSKPHPLHAISKLSQPNPKDWGTKLGCLLLLAAELFFFLTCAMFSTACFHPFAFLLIWSPWLCQSHRELTCSAPPLWPVPFQQLQRLLHFAHHRTIES